VHEIIRPALDRETVLSDIDSFAGIEDPRALAEAIVETVVDPLVVLDEDLRVVMASRSFYLTFEVDRQATQGRLLYELGDGQWDIPELRLILEKVLPERRRLDGYQLEREFPKLGRRVMQLSARQVHYASGGPVSILLSIADITERRALERRLEDLLEQKDVLLAELQHRVANSLAIIASILLLKAKSVQSDETRRHLTEAHDRVLSLATVQKHFHAVGRAGWVDVGPYLTRLCDALAQSMASCEGDIVIAVDAGEGSISSSQAVSLGLIVTELIINALKHGFAGKEAKDGRIDVIYRMDGKNDWSLTVADNGQGIVATEPPAERSQSGLGRSIVEALANQLNARVETQSGPGGTAVSIICASGAS
jgi:chemotaxis protein methyltransferase CheR